jgi:hypothetical protein
MLMPLISFLNEEEHLACISFAFLAACSRARWLKIPASF